MYKSVPADVHDRLVARVVTGHYASEEDVLRDAMDALDQLEEEKLLRWRHRNEASQLESQQGLSRPLNDDAVLKRLRDRLALSAH